MIKATVALSLLGAVVAGPCLCCNLRWDMHDSSGVAMDE
jgi:hypothetical protein